MVLHDKLLSKLTLIFDSAFMHVNALCVCVCLSYLKEGARVLQLLTKRDNDSSHSFHQFISSVILSTLSPLYS